MKVFSNLATSLDGKIATRSKQLYLLGSQRDHQEMQRLRRQAQAILIGASTLRSYRLPNLVFGARNQPINALLSSRLEGISPSWPFFKEPRLRRVLFVSPQCPSSRLKKFEKSSEIVILSHRTKTSAHQICQWFKASGIKSLLVEGGGGVMWDFVSQNLIDEYHVTLTPKLVGGSTAPTLVDGVGFLPKQVLTLQLNQCRVVGQEIYLIYSRSR